MRQIALIIVALFFATQSYAAILCETTGGNLPTTKTSLENALADNACKNVRVTSALSAVQSNISSATVHAWPSDRTLKIEMGGSINPTTKFTGLPYAEPEWFGAVGDGVHDDGPAIQNAITAVTIGKGASSGFQTTVNAGRVVLGAKKYRITQTINIRYGLTLQGAGVSNTIILLDTGTVKAALDIGPTEANHYVIGGSIGGFSIVCNAGAVQGDGMILRSADITGEQNSVITQLELHNIRIWAPRRGMYLRGVIYMCNFHDITITRSGDALVTEYGIYVNETGQLYNTYKNMEVTGVGNGAYAYYMAAYACQFINITADGCCYFSGPYAHIQGLAIEGIYSATPASKVALTLNQFQSVSDIALVNIPNAKCNIGISSSGTNININNVRFPFNPNVAPALQQPNRPIYFGATSSGVLSSVMMTNCVTKLRPSDFGNVTVLACDDITDYSLSHKTNTWVPAFTTWSTAPTVVSAEYVKIGRQVTVTLYALGGVCADGSTITGLPFTSSATLAFAGVMSSADVTKRFTGSILPSATTISNIPGQTLTGVYWAFTATYFL